MNSPTGFAPGRFAEAYGSVSLEKISSEMEKDAFWAGLGRAGLWLGKKLLSPLGTGAKTGVGKVLQRSGNFVGSAAMFDAGTRVLSAGAPPPVNKTFQRFNYGLAGRT